MGKLIFHLTLHFAQQRLGAAGFTHIGAQQSPQAILQRLQFLGHVFAPRAHDFASWIPLDWDWGK